MTVPLWEMESERLYLSPWADSDVELLHALHNQPQVQHFLDPTGAGWSREKVVDRMAAWRAEARDLGLGKHPIRRKSDDAFVGRAGFSPYDDGHEIGYILAHEHWGHGYASEIAAALRDWYFANRDEPAFIGFAHTGNGASLRILEKIGMQKTHMADVVGLPHHFFVLERPDAR